jgi:1-phosphofructokinase
MGSTFDAVTVTLNAAIDRTISIANFTAGAVNRVEHERSTPGGKGINVASALADAGRAVAVSGFLGRSNVEPFEELFARKRIADHSVRVAGETRVGIKIVDPALGHTTDINFPGAAPDRADLEELIRRLASLDAEWWVLSGSLPPGVEPEIYRDLVRTIKARGRRVLVDTSGEPLRHALEAAPHVVKPNVHEIEALLGRGLPDAATVVGAARELVASGIELVVVSMGQEGACLVTAGDAWLARPPDVEVRSTVGAGDAMVAGIVDAQLETLPLEACARVATAFAVHALTRRDSGGTARAGIDALAPSVVVRRVA